MDRQSVFHTEAELFAAAVNSVRTTAPDVPSCPGWSVSDLVIHVGSVHRGTAEIVRSGPPDSTDRAYLGLPADTRGWPQPDQAPNHTPIPPSLIRWFTTGAADLATVFDEHDPTATAWTWSREQTVGFWLRTQTIELSLHRWDAQAAIGTPTALDPDLAADAVLQTFEVMAPARRQWRSAPPGKGERFSFRRTDGPDHWTITTTGDTLTIGDGPADVELAGTASDLALFLWHRIPAPSTTGDAALVDRYFELVPPV